MACPLTYAGPELTTSGLCQVRLETGTLRAELAALIWFKRFAVMPTLSWIDMDDRHKLSPYLRALNCGHGSDGRPGCT